MRAQAKNYYARFIDLTKLMAKSGKTVIMRRYAYLAMALSPLAEATPPAGKTPTLTDFSATLLQFGDFIALSDYADMTGIDDYQSHWAGLLGDQAGYTMDAVTRDVMVAGTSVIYSNGTARNQVNTPIDSNDLDRSIRFLHGNATEFIMDGNSSNSSVNSFPVMPAYVGIIHPDVWFDLKNLTKFRSASEYKGAAKGEIGRYENVAFFMAPDVGFALSATGLSAGAKVFADAGGTANSIVKSTTGTSADVYATLIFGKHFATSVPLTAGSTRMYRQKPGGITDPIEQIMTMGWKNTSARLRTNERWASRVESAASV